MGKAFTNQFLWAAFLKKDIYLILDVNCKPKTQEVDTGILVQI